MFKTVFAFEIQNRFRRPAMYVYFAAALIFTVGSFSTGSLPLGDKENINAPFLIAFWIAGMTMMMMLVSSSIMGSAIFRDIEYNTKDYYLTYPVTRAGYFWGRFCGSFLCLLLIALAIPVGVWIGSHLGPAMGWKDAKEYGPNRLWYYLHPFLTIALPNLFFTSSLFFGLVAITRNVKVIYLGGITLFLGYFLSIFFLNHSNNATVINLSDPFGLNAVRFVSGTANSVQKNTTVFPIDGTFFLNRLLWSGLGLTVLLFTYLRFNFEKFFAGRRDKVAAPEMPSVRPTAARLKTPVSFGGSYNRRTFSTLVRLELQNIARDSYFWMIIALGMVFLGFVFSLGDRPYGVPDLPRTVVLFGIFNDVFPFFLFFLIIFYTGETLHRDRITRYAFINDALPPANWILNGSKLVSLLILGCGLALMPVVVALVVQLGKGFYAFNWPAYGISLFIVILPRFLEMVFFAYCVHVVVNNKFAAHGVGILIWVAVFLLRGTGTFDYNFLLYSYTPTFGVSDMDGIGHMATAVNWFNIYWLLTGGFLVILSALFYYRGVSAGFKERLHLAGQRFDRKTKWFSLALFMLYLPVAGFIYYNVSYLNPYLTKAEQENRAIVYEKALKKYQSMPLPKVTSIRLLADLFPDQQQARTHAYIVIVNRTQTPIKEMIIDGGELSFLSIKSNGQSLSFSCPLLYRRGVFNFFRPRWDTAEYRLYQLRSPLKPGDSTELEINTEVGYNGFTNMMYARNNLRNGTFYNGGLPGLGYDEGEELDDPYLRKKNGLAAKDDKEIEQDDSIGIRTLPAVPTVDLVKLDLTVSTEAGQTVVAPGHLDRQWKSAEGRSVYHFVAKSPGMYFPLGIVSARLQERRDSVFTDHKIAVSVFYHPAHSLNIKRFIDANKEGLLYFSQAFGAYPFDAIGVAETSQFSPRDATMTMMNTHSEQFSWNADFTDPDQFDYIYFNSVKSLADQWWRYSVTPNSTIGSMDISEGLGTYSALVMESRKYGELNIKSVLQDQLWFYLFVRRRMEEKEHPLLRANMSFEWKGKAGVVLYGLRDLIGEDSMNAALREFRAEYAFKPSGPYPGANDLYRILDRHVPDSLKYYLIDSWEKITLYNNRVIDAKIKPVGKTGNYQVSLTVEVGKSWMDKTGNDLPVKDMNDLIDIGIFAPETKKADGTTQVNPLYLKKHRLSAGIHVLEFQVNGKPVRAGIDPLAKLIDRLPQDNVKDF